MKREEILRSIDNKEVDFINRPVRVVYDNRLQYPLKFFYKKREHQVSDLIGTFKGDLSPRDITYLVKTSDKDIYLLCLHFHDPSHLSFLSPCHWILSFRVFRDEEMMFFFGEEKKMLVNMELRRAADFHGHLCPDLVIGYRACEYAQKLLYANGEPRGEFSVIAENCTSALDAIQALSGATVGNHRLTVFHFGKHNYTFSLKEGRTGFSLSLKKLDYGDEDEYLALEEKLIKNQASLNDMVYFQRLLDNRVKRLLALSARDLFDAKPVIPMQPTTEMPMIYHSCCACGQQVLKNQAIQSHGRFYCIPCFQELDCHRPRQNLH